MEEKFKSSELMYKLIVYYENNAKQNKNLFKTTESFEVPTIDCATSILFDIVKDGEFKIKKAFFNHQEMQIPEKPQPNFKKEKIETQSL